MITTFCEQIYFVFLLTSAFAQPMFISVIENSDKFNWSDLVLSDQIK